MQSLFREAQLVRVAYDASNTHVWGREYYGADGKYLTHFVANYICTHHTSPITLIKNLSNLYVLFGRKHHEYEAKEKWAQVLAKSDKLMEDMKTHECCPLAMVLISKNTNTSEYFNIEWVETFVRGYGFGQYVVQRVESELDSTGIPLDISQNYDYWVKILKKLYGTVEDLKQYYLEYPKIEWNTLIGYKKDMFRPKKKKKN